MEGGSLSQYLQRIDSAPAPSGALQHEPPVAFRPFAWGIWGLLGFMPTLGAPRESCATALLMR